MDIFKTGTRYHEVGRGGRLWPVAGDVAEQAIAQGATVIAKQAGEHWMNAYERHLAIEKAVEIGDEHLVRERYGDELVDEWFRSAGWNVEAMR